MNSIVDEDECVCPVCGHQGMLLAGGFNLECPVCETEISLEDEEEM